LNYCFFSAVLILVTKILMSSSVSCNRKFTSFGDFKSGTRWMSFNHLWVSLSSFNEILALVFVFHSTFDVGRSMFDVHPLLEQPLFQVIFLFVHISPLDVGRSSLPVHFFPVRHWKLKVRCWTFDVRCSSFQFLPHHPHLNQIWFKNHIWCL